MELRTRGPESYTAPGPFSYFSSLETHASVELGRLRCRIATLESIE